MSEMLQNDDVVKKTTDIENPEGSELATEKKEESEDKAETSNPEQIEAEQKAEQKAKAQVAYNKQYGATKQAQRERDAVQQELNQLKQAQVVAPEQVGQFPNEYDFDTSEEFETAKTAFISNVRANANFEAQQQFANQQQQQQQQAEFQQRSQILNEKAQSFMVKAKSYGITDEEVTQYANTVIAQYGIRDDVREAIIGQPEGVLMLKHLAANPQDVGALNAMNPYEAGAFIANELNQKAILLKPKQTSAPKPTEDIQGGSVNADDKYPFIGGATFE